MSDAARLIDQRIGEFDGWRGETLARVRKLILAADPAVFEEWKWDVPVWNCDGIICTGEVYKAAVKLTFMKGASVADPKKLFNSSLEGATRRALDLTQGSVIDEKAFTALIRAAIAANRGAKSEERRRGAKSEDRGKGAKLPKSRGGGNKK